MKFFRLLILLIAAHSCALGVSMLFFSRWMIDSFQFPAAEDIFFASQSGVFLLILGVCYFLALWRSDLIWVLLISKAFAVVFLFAHFFLLQAPTSVAAAGIGDATMLASVLVGMQRLGWGRIQQEL